MERPVELRSRWTEEEDQRLIECKSRNPDQSWEKIAKLAGLNRTGKSCRERWKNHLDPNVKRENFSQEEDNSIICFQSLYGNSWASIAAHLPGRTDNDVKNRWYNHLNEKKLGRSTGDQPHTTQLFHLDHNIDPNASSRSSSSSIPTLVSASQEIANPWPTSELVYPEFPREYLPSDDETIHHSFGGDYFGFEPTQLFDFNQNIDPNASSGSIPPPVSTSQEIANPWSTSELANPEFPRGYLLSDDETIHHCFRGDYFGFEPTQLFDFNHNIDPNASSGSIPTLVSASQEIANPWSTSELVYPEFPRGYLPSDDETIHHSFGGDYFGFEPTQLFDFNHNIDPNASSGSIPPPVSTSQEIANPWSTSELANPEFPRGYLLSDDETIHHSFRGDYFGFEPAQLFDFNHNIDPNASSGSIPTLVSASQEIANPWSTSELVYPEFPRGYLPSDDETIHHSFGGDYFGFEPTQLFDFNHNIDPNASSGSIPPPVSTSQEIANPWSTSELANPEFPRGYLPSDDENIHHSFRGDYFEPWIPGPFSASLESEFMPTEDITRF